MSAAKVVGDGVERLGVAVVVERVEAAVFDLFRELPDGFQVVRIGEQGVAEVEAAGLRHLRIAGLHERLGVELAGGVEPGQPVDVRREPPWRGADPATPDSRAALARSRG